MIIGLAVLAAAAALQQPAPAADPCASGADEALCEAAIVAETNPKAKTLHLLHRAFARDEKADFENAVKDLDAALAIDPAYADGLHERAYALGELGEYSRAVKDLDREIAIRPDSAKAYQERAYARRGAGDLPGVWADRDREVALDPGKPGPILARAEAALWLGRFDDASRDISAGAALAAQSSDQDAAHFAETLRQHLTLLSARSTGGLPKARCDSAWKAMKFDDPNLIGDCTSAFLAAPTGAAKARILTTRSIAWMVGRQDPGAATLDHLIAVALDPGNPDWHTNLAGSYAMAHHSWTAAREFDRSLAIRESWMALAGRAGARYTLGRKDEAFADAKRSFEIHPNELALIVLGDLVKDRGDSKSAKLYWMGAYHLGAHGDDLIARLKSVGVDHPEQEAKP